MCDDSKIRLKTPNKYGLQNAQTPPMLKLESTGANSQAATINVTFSVVD